MTKRSVLTDAWTTIGDLAEQLGCSRRKVERALNGDTLEIDGALVEVEQRPVEPEDFEELGLTRRTTRVVRVQVSRQSIASQQTEAIEDALNGFAPLEDVLQMFQQQWEGATQKTVQTGGEGPPIEVPLSPKEQQDAGNHYVKLRTLLDDRERNYIPRELVADALVSTVTLLGERLSSMPSRLADQLSAGATTSEIRETLTIEIDEVRAELGDAAERHLAQLLGTT